MAVNPLPPQAYTKETLQKAYAWLLTQSASIKEMASSQDMMISLYLKAQRSGDASLETPSIQNFKQELKSLAGIMGDLQVPSQPAYQSQSVPPSHMATSVSAANFAPQPANYNPSTMNSIPLIQMSTTAGSLDVVSMQYLNEVKQGLNLSSDSETLRALIAMGFKQYKKM